MTNCKRCNAFQNRLKKGGLCDNCANANNNYNGPANSTMNTPPGSQQFASGSPWDDNLPGHGSNSMAHTFSARQTMPPGGQHFTSNAQQMQGQFPRPSFQSQLNMQAGVSSTPQSTQSSVSSGITAENINGLMQKPISELTVADIIQINRISNDPIQRQLNSIESELKQKIQTLDNRVNILELNKSAVEEENAILRSTISNIQKSLNRIDSDARNKNIVITGLPEEDIRIGENQVVRNDEEKIKWILRLTENSYFDNKQEPFNASRLGEPKPGYNRVLKVVLPSIDERNEFLKNSIKMKEAPEPWSKVYIKKDQHPVYLNENNRLRKKAAELRKKQGNEQKDIKIQDGKLMMDNVVIDQNLFFR